MRVWAKEPLRQATLLVQGPLGLRTVRDLPALDARKDGKDGKEDGKLAVRVPVTDDMAPAARVMVYGVTADGHLVADVTAIKVNKTLAPVSVQRVQEF